MKKKKNSQAVHIEESSILSLLSSLGRPVRFGHILDALNIESAAKKSLSEILQNLQIQNKLIRLPGGFWSLPENSQYVTGTFHILSSGGGRVKITDPPNYKSGEIFISPFQTGGAWHNDIVKVALMQPDGSKGKVLKIIERTAKILPAILADKHRGNMVFKAVDAKIPHRFIIRQSKDKKIIINQGEAALIEPVQLLETTHKGELWEARFIETLGDAEQVSTQEKIVKVTHNVPGEFPPLAKAQAKAFAPFPSPVEIASREDMRDVPFVTIDGANAKDFDDAIHVEKTVDGWLLRVAIADVSHYVQPDDTPGSLDAEALARGNSWYFPRSVEPMLPEALSNGLCSLKPNEDRLAMLAELRLDQQGKVTETRFAPIAMRSAARLVYEDVADFFDGNLKSSVPDRFRPMLNDAQKLYEILSRKRREQGTLDFILPEPAYKFDQDGKLQKMGKAIRTDANMLIEEFMIAANEAVAEFLQSKDIPILYRDHAPPERIKLEQLYSTLKVTALETLPPDIEKDGKPDPYAIQTILNKACGTSKEYAVNRLCLRSMSQARYEPENIGHFGLASKAYCHFTSPIRRYADLSVHRALKYALGLTRTPLSDAEQLKKVGDELNGLERRAIECEREMAKRLSCLALAGKEGSILPGTISGVTNFGIFVEFDEMPSEGLIRMEELGNDWYDVDLVTQTIKGVRNKQRWQLGQPIRVLIKSVNLSQQEIHLAPANLPDTLRHKKSGKKTRNSETFSCKYFKKGKKNQTDNKNRRKIR